MTKSKSDRYRYVINHFNTLIQNGKDNEICSKYFYKGLNLLREYDPVFCDKLEYLHKGSLERKARHVLLLLVMIAIFPQLLPYMKIKLIGFGG